MPASLQEQLNFEHILSPLWHVHGFLWTTALKFGTLTFEWILFDAKFSFLYDSFIYMAKICYWINGSTEVEQKPLRTCHFLLKMTTDCSCKWICFSETELVHLHYRNEGIDSWQETLVSLHPGEFLGIRKLALL